MAKTANGKPHQRVKFFYRTYNFDRDPVLDTGIAVIEKSNMTFKEVHSAGGATPGTLYRWMSGKGRTCHFNTLMATIRACKADMVILMKDGSHMPIAARNSRR